MNISVVIPTYNYGRFLAFALDSVLNQTRPAEEIVVVDDGSTDNTREVAERYAGRIRYIHQNNAGLSAARNTGTREATSEWIAYLDSDDAWMPDKLRQQEQNLKAAPDCLLSYTGMLHMDATGAITRSVPAPAAANLWPRMRARNLFNASSVVVRRDAILDAGGFNEQLRACEDWDMWVRLRVRGPFTGISAPLTIIRLTPASMSSNVQRMIDNMELIREKTLLDGLSTAGRILWTRRIRSVAAYHAAMTAREFDRKLELKYLIRSLAYWPSPFLDPERHYAFLAAITGATGARALSSIVRYSRSALRLLPGERRN